MVVFVSSAFLLDTHKILHLCFAAFFAIYTVAFLQSTKAEASSFPNVALNKATFQGPGTRVTNRSVIDPSVYTSQKAVDGNNSTNRLDCTATDTDFSPDITIQWWLVDLGAPYYIHMVALLNRENFHDRLQNFTVDLFLEDPRMGSGFPKTLGTICGNRTAPVGQGQWAEFTCQSGPVLGRFVRVVKWFKRWLSLCEVKVLASTASLPLSGGTFGKTPNSIPQSAPRQFLGHFSSPIDCGLRMLQHPDFNAYHFCRLDGSCQGYTMGAVWTVIRAEQCDTYVEL